jgi:acyl carrier protein
MISERLKLVILKELNLNEFDFTDDMMANQVPGWDSLNHMNIIMAVENEYNFKFKALEILKMRKIGDLQKAIDIKLSDQ